jgi:hypothetical protein
MEYFMTPKVNLLYIKKILWVWMYVCSLIVKEELHQFNPNLECLSLYTSNRFQKAQKRVKGSSSSEGGFCSLETKRNRRMMLRSKLFVSMRRLQE